MTDSEAPTHPSVQLVARVDRVTVAARTQLHGDTYAVTVTAHRHPKNAEAWVFTAATPDGTYRSGNVFYEGLGDEHVAEAVERQAQEYASRLVTATARRHAAADDFNRGRSGLDYQVDPDDFPDVPPVEFPDPEVIDPGPQDEAVEGVITATVDVDSDSESWDPRR